MLLTFAQYLYIFFTLSIHPFHVSVCEIYHNHDTNSLEISMKIFTDDLELSIQKYGNSGFSLIDARQADIDKNLLETYLIKKFSVTIDGENVKLVFLGFEFDDNAIICYFESKKVKRINKIEIQNSIITETFDDQINLTHFQYKEEMKSLKATKDSPVGLIDTSAW